MLRPTACQMPMAPSAYSAVAGFFSQSVVGNPIADSTWLTRPTVGWNANWNTKRHRQQRRGHRQEVDRAIEAAQGGAGLDQQRDAESEQHRQRHRERDVDQRVAQRRPEHGVAEHLDVVFEADASDGRRAERPVGQRQRDHRECRAEQQQPHQRDAGPASVQAASSSGKAAARARRFGCAAKPAGTVAATLAIALAMGHLSKPHRLGMASR